MVSNTTGTADVSADTGDGAFLDDQATKGLRRLLLRRSMVSSAVIDEGVSTPNEPPAQANLVKFGRRGKFTREQAAP